MKILYLTWNDAGLYETGNPALKNGFIADQSSRTT
jgi:hypothetical protein